MRRVILVPVLLVCGATAPGCGTLLTADGRQATVAESLGGMRREMAAGWSAARDRFDRMREEIRQDLLLHEHEGLEAFGPGSVEQVEHMRRDMNAHSEFVPRD